MNDRDPLLNQLFSQAGRQLSQELIRLVTEPTRDEPAEARSARSAARREDAEEVDRLRRRVQELRRERDQLRLELSHSEADVSRLKETRRTGQALVDRLRDEKTALAEELYWYRDRFGRRETLEADVSEPTEPTEPTPQDAPNADPYPRFWRWAERSTHFFRVEQNGDVWFKFRASEDWRRAPSHREHDLDDPKHKPLLTRDFDNPDDPQNRPGSVERRPTRAFRRAPEPVGHGTDDGSHTDDIWAQLPGNWPLTVRQLVHEVDINQADWRTQLCDAFLVTLDDWVRSGTSRRAHDTTQRATGARD